MITISYPCNNTREKKYIIDILFGEFLGLEFKSTSNATEPLVSIFLENGNTLKINDSFFSNLHKVNESYLNIKNIPSEIISMDIETGPEKNIIGLFGKQEIIIKNNEIYCGIDLLASSFFMLTRWEEHVIKDRDIHGRFPLKSSLAYKHNFLSRPVVNEYIEVIWHWLITLGISQARKKRQFKFINTHDIDRIKLFDRNIDFIAKPVKALLVDKTLSSLLHHTNLALQSLRGKDPYLAFNYFMDTSEQHNLQSHFFFMAAKEKTKYDNGYNISDKFIYKIINHIENRGHIIGIHPSYNTFNNPELLASEINSMRKITTSDVICGRQHYLRFDLPNTWEAWNNNSMEWDSSLAYSEHEGFRCGVCYPFSVFNILSRKKLKLKEKPLIIMDTTLQGARKLPQISASKIINHYISTVKKYSGEFVFLWHNSSFSYLGWRSYKKVYENTLALSGNNQNVNTHCGYD